MTASRLWKGLSDDKKSKYNKKATEVIFIPEVYLYTKVLNNIGCGV
jgi:hypothetical protein